MSGQERSMATPTHQLCSVRAYHSSTLTSYVGAVERVITAMRAQVSEPLSLEDMAEMASLSPFHFHRIFRSLIGIPPGEFLAALRLDAAKRLLLTTSLSVTDVCFELGYTSLGTFTTRFSHLIGLSPRELRHLAEGDALAALEPIYERTQQAKSPVALHPHGVSGTITVPGPFTGLIFVGLFPRPLPQGRPLACTTLAAPGPYHLALVPDGRSYLFAAALPSSPSARSYLLPGPALLVGTAEQPVVVRGGRAGAPVDLALRLLNLTDPPILGIFPPLLATSAAARVHQPG